jgi:hypothetical protein
LRYEVRGVFRPPTSNLRLKHDIATLEIAVEEVTTIGLQKEICEGIEVVFEELLVEGSVSEFEEVIFEIVEVP